MAKIPVKFDFSGNDVVPAMYVRMPDNTTITPVNPGTTLPIEEDQPHMLICFVLGPPGGSYEAKMTSTKATYEIKTSRNPVKKSVPATGKGWFTQPFSVKK